MKDTSADMPFPTLAELLNRIRPGYGDTYQNGVEPGPRKLAQFQEALRITAHARPLRSRAERRCLRVCEAL